MKLSNKATSLLCLLSKCSFTPSKLRFFELRKPKISSCYTTSQITEAVHKTCWTASHSVYGQITLTEEGLLSDIYTYRAEWIL